MPKKKRKRTATKNKGIRKPQSWDKVVSVAYLRLLGASQEQAAKQAGAGKRSVYSWEHSPWWGDALNEARNRWLHDCDAAAMRGVTRAFSDPEEYAKHSRWYADRRIPELAPPTTRTELTGANGGPVEIKEHREHVDSLVSRLAAAISEAKDTQ